MSGLVAAMLRARRGQALTMLLLAIVAVAAAVAGPAFLAAADRSLIAVEVSRATPAELTLATQNSVDLGKGRDRSFENEIPALLSGPWLDPVFAAEYDAYLTGPADSYTTRLAFRENVCPHLTVVSGRCPIGSKEVVIGAADADHLGVHIGQTLLEQESVRTPDGPVARGPTGVLTVVGVFVVPDPSDRYWADQHYFDAPATGGPAGTGGPVFTGRGTLEALPHAHERQSVDSLLDPAALTPARLSAVRAELAAVRARSTRGQVRLGTSTDALFNRIGADRSALREVVPLAAVALVLLAWLLLAMTAGQVGHARRAELALLRLRGLGRPTRWWLAFGEATLTVLAAAPLGYLAGYGLVAVTARALLPGAGPVAPSWQPLRWAAVALAGALVAAVLAQRRTLVAPVTEQLREVPPRGGARRELAVEAVVSTLAVAAVVQLRAASGPLTGVALLAPALVVFAVALLAARTAGPVIARLGARALRRGRLGPALGALRLARRPGAPRLLALLTVAVAQLTFALGAADVAAQARDERVAVELGAPRVLTVQPVGRGRLLGAVRAADPDGRYAMAVATVPKLNASDPPMLAVDATRLARVAVWRPNYGALSATEVAARLRPATPDPIVLATRALTVDLSADRLDPAARLRLFAYLAPLDGTPTQVAILGDLVPGRHRYGSAVPACQAGCRLTALEVSKPSGGSVDATLVLHGVYRDDPPVPVPVDLVHSGHWRAPVPEEGASAPVLTPGPDGLRVAIHDTGSGDDAIVPVDAPLPLPVVTAGRPAGDLVRGLDGKPVPATAAGTATVLPRVGTSGGLVDLEYADRDAREFGDAIDPQVWLTADAPATVTDRLRAAGLTIVDSQSDADRVRYLSRQGPGTGLRFHLLAGALAVALALAGLLLVAVVDRRGPGRLDVLRLQGVPRRVLRGAVRRGYLGLAGSALLLGPVAAAAAWALTGAWIPVFADGARILAPPAWPRWPAPVLAWAGCAALLLCTALFAAGVSRPRDSPGGGAPLPSSTTRREA